MEYLEKERLIKEAKKGSVDAFSKLYEEIYKELYKFALYILNSQQDAEDVVSETVIAAFEGIKGLRDVNLFKPWIFKILTNKCKKNIKRKSKKIIELNYGEDVYIQNIDEKYDLKEAFNKLKEEERIIISLSTFGGYKSNEIAEMLNLNANTVRSKQSRAFSKLKDLLNY